MVNDENTPGIKEWDLVNFGITTNRVFPTGEGPGAQKSFDSGKTFGILYGSSSVAEFDITGSADFTIDVTFKGYVRTDQL